MSIRVHPRLILSRAFPPRRRREERSHNRDRKDRIRAIDNPPRRCPNQDEGQQSIHEGAAVDRLLRRRSRLVLPGGQRAIKLQETFYHDNQNREQMSNPKPWIANPFPPPPRANQNRHQSAYDINDVGNMYSYDQISK